MAQPPWNVYANQLFPQGFGYPLWLPEPDPSAREVSLGDVGWLDNGSFLQLFNSRIKLEEDQLRKDVPNDFTPFNPPNLIVRGPMKSLAIPPLCSQTVKTVDASGSGQANIPIATASAGASFSFTCEDNNGAFLMFSPAAITTEIKSRRHIINYMRLNFAHWMEYANEKYGLDLKEQDIMFVCGTTKTARWAVAALQGNCKKKMGSVTANLSSVAGLNMTVSIADNTLPQTHRKIGPSRSLAAPASVPLVKADDSERTLVQTEELNDQCLFIHYYQMKRRLWFLNAIKAAAGSDKLPPPGPDGADVVVRADEGVEGADEDEFEQASKTGGTWNPVNDLLNYILGNSDASVSIASDLDIYALFKDKDFPLDIAGALKEFKPTVDVDEDGVGTVAVQLDLGPRAVDDTTQENTEQLNQSAEDVVDQTIPNPSDPEQTGDDVQDAENDVNEEDKDGQKRIIPGAQASVHDGSITALAYSPNGRYAASGSEDTTVIIWDVHGNHMMYKLTPHLDTVSALAFSHGNEVLASGSNDQNIILWNVTSGQEIRRLEPHIAVHSLAFSPDGSKLVAGAYDGSLFVWNTETYEDPVKLSKHVAVVTFVVFSSDGRYTATGGTESECYVWDMTSLEPKSVLRGHKGMVCSAAFAPDGERIVTASDDGSSRIWKTETGEALVILHEHSGPVWTVAFSPDGKRVASGSSDSTVKVCDSYSGDRQLSLDGHDSMINVVEFSPDGRYIASAASDNTVRLWKAEDGSAVATYNEHSDNVTAVTFSPDSSTLASGSHDGTVRIRPLHMPTVG
ncbi:WD40-repeat-containing domain protein [Dichomitus squalens]|uniref:WD40-repeat-containing domain protein n=1 Tax=Dichomitus squalens TaxID=114155 RepID=A0A4Q9PHU2_9APHY|nr:WD40-repeat-containing domain protein [Dichomitus squalens]